MRARAVMRNLATHDTRIARSISIGCSILLLSCSAPNEEAPASDRAGDSASPSAACVSPHPTAHPDSQVVAAYFPCERGNPGQLYPAFRHVAADRPAIEAALGELLRGPTPQERALGLHSLFGSSTADALRSVVLSAQGDTVTVDLEPLAGRLPANSAAKSFLPPGVMAELTSTIFAQFADVEAVRFAFDGSEETFWHWLDGPPQIFTRSDWEQI
jgi:hypothetical protein